MPKKTAFAVSGLPPGTSGVSVDGNLINITGEYPITFEDFADVKGNVMLNPGSRNFVNPGLAPPIRLQAVDLQPNLQGVFLVDQLRTVDLTPQARPYTGGMANSYYGITLPYEGTGPVQTPNTDFTDISQN